MIHSTAFNTNNPPSPCSLPLVIGRREGRREGRKLGEQETNTSNSLTSTFSIVQEFIEWREGKEGRERERERKTYVLYEYLQYLSFLPIPFKLLLLVLYNATTNQPINQSINQSTGSIASPRYSNNNMILVSRAFFFSLTNTVQAKNTCIRTYYSIPLPIVPPSELPYPTAPDKTPYTNQHSQPTTTQSYHLQGGGQPYLPTCLPEMPYSSSKRGNRKQ